jgi:hypothetical protein
MMRLLDGTLALLLLVAAGVFKRSDYIRHCDTYGYMLTCQGLATAMTATVVAVVCFAVGVGLTFVPLPSSLDVPPVGYVAETTPARPVLSPTTSKGNNLPTPSTKR